MLHSLCHYTNISPKHNISLLKKSRCEKKVEKKKKKEKKIESTQFISKKKKKDIRCNRKKRFLIGGWHPVSVL